MLFSNLKTLLRHFGFQLEDGGTIDDFLGKADSHQALCWIRDHDLLWYVPRELSQKFISNYKAEAFFFLEPEPVDCPISHWNTYKLSIPNKEYEDLLQLVEFLESGYVQAFYVDGASYIYPEIFSVEDPEIDDYEKALEDYPHNAILLNYMGQLAKDNNEFELAASYFVDACEVESHYALPYFNMGALLWEKGDKEKAFHLFYEAMLRNPFNEEIQDYFVKAGLDLDEIDKMEHCLERVRDYFPDFSGLLYLQAVLLEKSGKEEECRSILEKLLQKHPEDKRAQNFLHELQTP